MECVSKIGIFSQLSIIQYVELCVFNLPISLVMIEKIYILCLIIIIKSEVWTFTYCLGLGYETMVRAACLSVFFLIIVPLQWRHNQRDGVSNHQRRDCLLDCFVRRRLKKLSKFRVTGLCEGNRPVTGDSPHKGSVTRKLFPFDDVIMWQM